MSLTPRDGGSTMQMNSSETKAIASHRSLAKDAVPRSMTYAEQKTYRNQAMIDVIGKGKKFQRILLNSGTLFAITDYHKATGNGTDPGHPLLQTLGKHGPYPESLTHKSVDCLVRSVVKRP